MAEPEGVVTGKRRGAPGRTSSLRTSAGQVRGDLRLLGRERRTAPRWNTCPRPRRARAPPARRPELVEPSGQQRLDGRRHADTRPSPRSADHREHLLDEERIALGRRADSPAEAESSGRPSSSRIDQLVGLGLRERLEEDGRRVELAAAPRRPSGRAARAGRGRGAGSAPPGSESATCSTSSRKAGSPQWMSSRRHDQRPLRGPRLEQPADAQAISLGRGRLDLPSSASSARRAASSPSSLAAPDCLTISTTGQ